MIALFYFFGKVALQHLHGAAVATARDACKQYKQVRTATHPLSTYHTLPCTILTIFTPCASVLRVRSLTKFLSQNGRIVRTVSELKSSIRIRATFTLHCPFMTGHSLIQYQYKHGHTRDRGRRLIKLERAFVPQVLYYNMPVDVGYFQVFFLSVIGSNYTFFI